MIRLAERRNDLLKYRRERFKPLVVAETLNAEYYEIIFVDDGSRDGTMLQLRKLFIEQKCPVKVTRIGVKDTFGESGPAKELLKKYELDAEGIYKQIKAGL